MLDQPMSSPMMTTMLGGGASCASAGAVSARLEAMAPIIPPNTRGATRDAPAVLTVPDADRRIAFPRYLVCSVEFDSASSWTPIRSHSAGPAVSPAKLPDDAYPPHRPTFAREVSKALVASAIEIAVAPPAAHSRACRLCCQLRGVPPPLRGHGTKGPRQRASQPPSTGSTVPWMYFAAGEARKTAAPAMSEASPQRPAGMRSRIAFERSGSARRACVLLVSM